MSDPGDPQPGDASGADDWSMPTVDRDRYRRKVRRALAGLVVVVLAVGLLAYGCSRLQAPRGLTLPPTLAGLTLRSGDPEAGALRAQLQSAGANPAVAGHYVGPNGDVLLLGSARASLPSEALERFLPTLTEPMRTYTAKGGALLCGPTTGGSRCEWGDTDVIAATVGQGLTPLALARLTQRIRAAAVQPLVN